MNMLVPQWTWSFDGWIVAAGILCAVASSLLGNFLVLRRMSMLGDAITHAVLPGLAIAFFISDSRSSLPMFVGAVIVGLMTAVFTEWIRSAGDVDEGASMGVVFTTLFALGLVLVAQAADHVDLDPGCVLYGAIELTPLDTVELPWQLVVPRAVLTLSGVTLLNLIFVVVFLKELKITSFDPGLATTSGFSSRLMHYLLMILVAVTAVASFESVGNILVVAMFVVPPAAAYMLTDRLSQMILISAVLAAASAIIGHVAAIIVPGWFGYGSVPTAGMMAVAAGLIFFLAATLGPRHGVLVKLVRHMVLAFRILTDDVVALLYRMDERGAATNTSASELQGLLLSDAFSLRCTLAWLIRTGHVEHGESGFHLTEAGRIRAAEVVRSHRLWEQYLVSQAGVAADRIHDTAEQLEHFTSKGLRERLNVETDSPQVDPHGSTIPAESNPTAKRS